ncbi:MAG: hypothetical protein ACYDEY_11110 [Acidimicrobiales bacterium]
MQDNSFGGVYCRSSNSCTAVGSYYSGTAYQTLIEAWNGASWSIIASPDRSASTNNELYRISCASATSCTAVGAYNNGAFNQTLAERWNGTTWSIVASHNTAASQFNALDNISCVSVTSCIAVGSSYNHYAQQALIEAWNGTSWSIVASADTSSSATNALNAVSCASETFCTAVGLYDSVGIPQTLVEMIISTTVRGYWFVASDGGIFSFGDAKFYGSMGDKRLNKPIVGMAAT